MLKVSKEKGVVTHLSNLYDTFFEGGRDHKEKATSTAMPYLDGKFLPLLHFQSSIFTLQLGAPVGIFIHIDF